MTIKLKLKDIKDKLKDDSLDLSLCEIKEVPVREIASVRKATNVNLSNNFLVSLPANFIILKQIIKLDLSKNELTEIPENFGEMIQLKHLDLYSNKISRLPLSLGELKNLNWLDLKENPLTEAVASVAGPCSNMHECQVCARNIVNYLSNVKISIEKKKLELSNTIDETKKIMAITKKENKKKKKKNVEKENKTNRDKSEFRIQNKVSQNNDDNVKLTELSSNNICIRKSHKTTGTGLCRSLTCMVVWFFIISSLLTVALISLSWYYEQQTDTFLQNAQMLSGLPLKNYHKHITDYLQHITKYTTVQIKSLVDIVNSLYKTQFQSNTNAEKEL